MRLLAIALSLMMILWISCDTQAQYEPKEAGLIWEYPRDIDQGVIHFVLYAWSGTDTNLVQLDSIGIYPFNILTSPDTMEYRPFPITDAYTQAGAVAVDSSGLRSAMSKTRFYGYWEFYGPEKPMNLEVRK